MTSALALPALLLVIAAPPGNATAPAGTAKFQVGQSEFKRGDFLGALRTLDAAAADATDDQLLTQIHLLRGQCLAARQDLPAAEEAFGLALVHDPEASLDPSKVDPALVRTLDTVRKRLRGALAVQADRTGAQASLDGKSIGQVPLKSSVSIGKHSLEVRSVDGLYGAKQDVVVRYKQTTQVSAHLKELPAAPRVSEKGETIQPEDAFRPFADIRGTVDPFASGKNFGVEVGGGLEYRHFRGSVNAILYPDFGIDFRGALGVPVADRFSAYISLEIPIVFAGSVQFGLGGAGGLEYDVTRWFDPFFEVGVRHFFTGLVDEDPNRLVLQFGVRLKVP
ncbi:MAG TPA: tetratricopeptide repeat protein [Myxococcaceae bacterium]|nr:tetratricopeptide repeat protein [Myxococcaceae bacterium]